MSGRIRKRRSRAIPKRKPKPSSASQKPESPNTFPLAKLPLELREQVWEESLLLTRRPPSRRNLDDERMAESYSRLYDSSSSSDGSKYYFYATPILASVCREAHAVVKRLQRQGNEDAFELRAVTPFIFRDLDTHWSRNPTRPMASLVQGTDRPLVLDLPTITTRNEEALSLARGSGRHGDRVIQLLLAAQSNQIKILSRTRQRFILPPDTPKEITKGWYQRQGPGFVSIHDMLVWKELKSIATAVNLPWKMADTILDVESPNRQDLINRALCPLRDLWERHDARLRRAGMEGAKPLPEIDVILRVEFYICGSRIGFHSYHGYGEISLDYLDELYRYRY